MYSQDNKLKAVQKINLEMAGYFVDFCNQHDLLCYLCGGGAIGALREKGFIPWDDDLDFFMPRKDYEKLSDLWERYSTEKRYVLLDTTDELSDGNGFITIRDSKTTFIKPYQQDLDIVHGIPLDIFPLDYAPSGWFQRKSQKLFAMVRALYITQTIPEKHGKLLKLGSQLLLGLVPSRKWRYKISQFAERKMTKYNDKRRDKIIELCAGPYYMKNLYPAEAFEKARWVPFEDTTMPIPIKAEAYLSIAFGDFMKRPPKKEQVSHHDAIIVDPDQSYQNYKFTHYLVGKDEH